MSKQRTIVLPTIESDFSAVDGQPLAFWKQILPQKIIHYTAKSGKRAVLDFSQAYLEDLKKSFDGKVLDQLPFLLADKDNAHTMDAERQRGEVTDVRLATGDEAPGLYGKFVFPTAAAAAAVTSNPKLGVSARIREGVPMNDGSVVSRAMIHVLGTLDPQVTGMSPWVPAVDLSFDPTDRVLDLSSASYEEGAPVAKKETKTEAPAVMPTDAEIDAMTEAELDAFLAEHGGPDFADGIVPSEDEGTKPELKDESQLVGAGAELSAEATKDIELATAAAATANARAELALTRMAKAEWAQKRSEFLAEGVPAHLLDLTAPVLERSSEMVIDLSHTDSADINVSEILLSVLEASKGLIDMSVENGHLGVTSAGGEGDPDKASLDLWSAQFDN